MHCAALPLAVRHLANKEFFKFHDFSLEIFQVKNAVTE